MNKLPMINEMLREYEKLNGKEETFDFIEFLVNTYVHIINQFGTSLIRNGVDPNDLEKVILDSVATFNQNRNKYQNSDGKQKKELDWMTHLLSTIIMSSITSTCDNYSQWDNAPQTLQ